MGTFASYLSTGKGAVAFRLAIEGCPYEFVSDARMEGDLGDGRYRVQGLQSSGIQITESVYMAGAELNVSLSSLSITETAGTLYRDAATRAFTGWTAGSVKAYVSYSGSVGFPVDVSPSDTTIYIRGAAALTVGDYVHVGTEVWKVTAVTESVPPYGVGTDSIEVERGKWLTTAQAFPGQPGLSASGTANLYEISSAPATYAGRRVWLYGHGDSELDTGDTGTILWRGILSDNPELSDSRTWSLSMQPRTALLDAQIGNGVEGDIGLRGIYYPGKAPLVIDLIHFDGPNPATATQDDSTRIVFVGFYETQEAFCTALRTAITTDSHVATWTGTWDVRVRADGAAAGVWDLVYTPASGAPKAVQVGGGSPVDGWFCGRWINADVSSSVFIGTLGSVQIVVGGQQYVAAIQGPTSMAGAYAGSLPDRAVRRVPRANYHLGMPYRGSDANATSYPMGRFYMALDTTVIGDGSTFTLTPPKVDDADPDNEPLVFTVTGFTPGVNVDNGDSIILGFTTHGLSGFACAGAYQPTLTFAIRYGSDAGTTLAGFISALITEAPDSANAGTTPWITSDDINITDEVVVAAAGRAWAMSRDYVFGKQQKLSDVLREELKLLGMYMALDSSGKITFRRYPQDTAAPTTTIGAETNIVDDDFGTERIAPDGLISSVEIKRDYDPENEKWATTWNFKSPNAAATIKTKGQKLSIAPTVRPHSGVEPTADDMRVVAQNVLAWFGRTYYVITVPVAITAHSLRIGDTVLVTLPQLPYAGARGSTSEGTGLFETRATIVGRSWMYGDKPGGTLDLFVHGLNFSGYAPTLKVVSASGSGTSWTFTVEAAEYGPGGSITDVSFFASGYKVVLREWDSEAPTRRTGTVSSVDAVANTIDITLDSPWGGLGGATYMISFDRAGVVTEGQQSFTFMADPAGRITYAASSASARVFS